MALYATASELASYLQQDLDTATATLALQGASAQFARAADTAFVSTAVTWTVEGGPGTEIQLPYRPVISVAQVRLNGNVITGWTLRNGALYRLAGFGTWYAFPADELQVDLTYGYTTVPDDVKLAVLELAGGLYQRPDSGVQSETIDDYTIRYSGTPISPGRPWRDVAADYRGMLVA